MSMLDPPRHPVVIRALDHARRWCDGYIIDDAPAFTHAVLVARTLVQHVPDSPAEAVAAALLHDSPEFAPTRLDLEKALNLQVGDGVYPLVEALHEEHASMAPDHQPHLSNVMALLIAAADRIVAFRCLVERAERSSDAAGFFAGRGTLRRLVPYFHRWNQQAAPHLPDAMHAELCRQLSTLCISIDGTGSGG